MACLKKEDNGDGFSLKNSPIDTLLIGADGKVVYSIEVNDNMKPTTYTVPINKARQLMFWLQCGNWNSGIFIFYDVVLSKGSNIAVNAPDVNKLNSSAAVNAPVEPYVFPIAQLPFEPIEWSYPKRCGVDAVDNYFSDCKKVINNIQKFYESLNTNYSSKAVFVTSSSGELFRAISIVDNVGKEYDFQEIIDMNNDVIKSVKQYLNVFVNLNISKVNAGVGLIDLGFDAVQYGKLVNNTAKVMNLYKNQLTQLQKQKEKENELIKQLISQGISIDGVPSNDKRIFVK